MTSLRRGLLAARLAAALLIPLLIPACDAPATPDGGSDPVDSGSDGGASSCSRDSECGDRSLFCMDWRCRPGEPGTDARGCIDLGPPCDGGACDEERDRCGAPSWCTEGRDGCLAAGDCDGDGASAIECGGNDCDDDDGDRYPGNPEVCDAEGHDEDCDPTTVGDTDADGDTFVSNACCNTQADGSMRCGPDCDDSDMGINPSSTETCNARDDDCDGGTDEEPASSTPLCPGGMCMGGRCAFTGWDRTLGSPTLDDEGTSVAVDDAGNVFVLGAFQGTVNVSGTSHTSRGMRDIFVISYSPSGGVRWFTQIGAGFSDVPAQIAVAPTGSVFVAGRIGSTSYDFGNGERVAAVGTVLPFVVALSSADGAPLWDRVFVSDARVGAVSDGGVVVATTPTGTADVGGPAPVPGVGSGGADLHLVRYDAAGAYVWDARHGLDGSVFVTDVSVTSSGILVSGSFFGAIDLGDGTTRTADGRDYYAAGYDLADGANRWVVSGTGADSQIATAIVADETRVYVAGTNRGTVAFPGGPSHTASTAIELWLLSLGLDGAYQWSGFQEGSMSAEARGLAIDGTGGPVVVGLFRGTLNLGGGEWVSTRSGAGLSGFVAFFTDAGAYDSDRVFSSGAEADSAVYFADVDVGPGGSVSIVGTFEGTANFGLGDRSSGGLDVVSLRLAR